MDGKYVTPAVKQTMITIAGCIGFCEALLKAAPSEISTPKMKQRLGWARDHLCKVMDALKEGMDEDCLRGIVRQCKSMRMQLLPETDPRADKKYLLVEESEMQELLSCSLECGLCLKNATEVKQCEIRKLLARMGVVSKDLRRHECPYQP